MYITEVGPVHTTRPSDQRTSKSPGTTHKRPTHRGTQPLVRAHGEVTVKNTGKFAVRIHTYIPQTVAYGDLGRQ